MRKKPAWTSLQGSKCQGKHCACCTYCGRVFYPCCFAWSKVLAASKTNLRDKSGFSVVVHTCHKYTLKLSWHFHRWEDMNRPLRFWAETKKCACFSTKYVGSFTLQPATSVLADIKYFLQGLEPLNYDTEYFQAIFHKVTTTVCKEHVSWTGLRQTKEVSLRFRTEHTDTGLKQR